MSKSSFSNLIGRILLIILCCLFLIAFARFLFHQSSPVSFTAFLDWLGNIQSFTLNVNISNYTIQGSWGVLDFLRNFFNIFATLFGVILYLCANAINVIIFVGQFLAFLFVS